MPSGRTHLKLEAGLLFAWTASAGYLLARGAIRVEAVIAFVLAYAFSMLLLSPDLDLPRSLAFRRWGSFRWIWVPYAVLFRHRRLSHHPLLGPATRMIYLGGLVAVLAASFVVSLGRPWRVSVPSAGIVLGAVIGLYAPNMTHIIADRIVSRRRRKRRLRGRL